jgi:streptomycin 6-kinase
VLDPDFGLDPAARGRLLDRFGPDAAAWCAALPKLVDKYCLRWDLELSMALSGGTSCVFTGRQHGVRGIALKLTPDPFIAAREALALRAWAATRHAPELVAEDADDGVLLLERIEPGSRLSERAEPSSVTEIASLLTSLRSGLGTDLDQLPTLAERLDFLFALIRRRARDPRVRPLVPAELVDQGHRLCRSLAGTGDAGLVHGDLHPGNVLVAGPPRRLVAIDPRPCRGDRTFDVIDWALDRVSDADQLADRIERFRVELPELDADALRLWCAGTAVISVVQRLFHGRPLTDSTRFMLDLARSPADSGRSATRECP